MSISSMNECGREGDGLVYKESWSNITTQKQTGNGTDSSMLGGNYIYIKLYIKPWYNRGEDTFGFFYLNLIEFWFIIQPYLGG